MFVYILECIDKSYYVGVTNNIEKRLFVHNEGSIKTCYTFNKRPVQLKYYEEISDPLEAIAYEKKLKGWSRKKKEALFLRNYKEISRLSKSHASTSSA